MVVARTLLLFVLLALADLVHAQATPPANQSATLADSIVVTLEGVTYGKERRFFGMSLEPSPGQADAALDTRDAIILWISTGRPPTAPIARSGLQPGAARIYDDAGKECVACELGVTTRFLPNYRHAIMLYAWPRRSSEFVVEISYSIDPRHPSTAKFRVRNPQVLKTPPFPSNPTPITRQDKDLEVTLDGLHQMPPLMFFSGPPERMERRIRGQKLHTATSFQYKYHGQITKEWQPTDAVILDSVGSPYECTVGSIYQPFPYPLTYYRSDSDEPLKLGVWFQRTANAEFAPEETVTLNNLPMRLGDYLHEPGGMARIGDVTVELSSTNQVQGEGIRTLMTVYVYGGDPHLSLLMQVRNERGKLANGVGPNEKAQWIAGFMRPPDRFRERERANAGPHQCADFMMDLPRGTSRITITIAVNRSHYFEFTPTPNVLHDLSAR